MIVEEGGLDEQGRGTLEIILPGVPYDEGVQKKLYEKLGEEGIKKNLVTMGETMRKQSIRLTFSDVGSKPDYDGTKIRGIVDRIYHQDYINKEEN